MNMIVVNGVKELRKALGISQLRLSVMLSVSQCQVSKWESPGYEVSRKSFKKISDMAKKNGIDYRSQG